MIHQSIQFFSDDFLNIYKRRNYSTPKNYLDFISTYMKDLETRRKNLDSAVYRLTGGLATLEKTQVEVQELREVLETKNAAIAEKKGEVETLIADITEKSDIASRQAKEATEVKKKLDEDAIIINKEKAEADIELEKAQPAIAKAQAALLEV
jgi:dynein heavy chain